MTDEAGSIWWLYFIRCRSGEVYTGVCTDVERRFAEHLSGGARAARFLRGRAPLTLLGAHRIGSRSRALRAESRAKKLSRPAKLALAERGRGLEALLADV